MATRFIVGIVALACISICGVVATFTSLEIADKVNEKLPKGEQFALLGWYWCKRQRLHREYARLYPEGRLLHKIHLLTALTIACLLICIWSFGLFGR